MSETGVKRDKFFYIGIGALFFTAVLAGAWLFLRSPSLPDEDLLTKRFVRSIELGWPLLKVTQVNLEEQTLEGNLVRADFSYEIRLQQDYKTLPQEELERIANFLPMCVAGFKEGKTDCSLTESMEFVDRQGKGWMPLLVVQRRVDLIEAIAAP